MTIANISPFDPEKIWSLAQGELAQVLSQHKYQRYIETVRVGQPANELDDSLHLLLPSENAVIWFRENVLDKIQKIAIERLGVGEVIVAVNSQPELFLMEEVMPEEVVKPDTAKSKTVSKAAIQARTGLANLYRFENYFCGSSNEIAVAAGLKLASENGAARTISPLFIHGSVGLGKSHLAHATGNRFLELNPDARIRLLSGEQFMREVQQSFTGGKIQSFREHFRKLDMLIIDDIQMIGRESEQTHKQFLGLFNYMDERELPIVITSDRPASQLNRNMPNRLLSRLTVGVDVVVGVPDLDTRVGILCAQARTLFDIELPGETARLVASRLRNNCRELVGALRSMAHIADSQHSLITPTIASRVIGDMTTMHADLSIQEIIEQTARYYKLKPTDLRSQKRISSLVLARHIAMHLCRELTQHSLPDIGAAFGRHHSSVLHACKKINQVLHKDVHLDGQVSELRQQLCK